MTVLAGSSPLSGSTSHSKRTGTGTGHSHHRAASFRQVSIGLPWGDVGLLNEGLDSMGSHLGGLYLGGEEDDGAKKDEGELEDL